MAENIDVNVNVNSNQAQRNLANLDKQIAGVTAGFSKLRSALGTIAFGSIINNALNFAATMVDISKSTDIAVGTVLGFSRAVQDNGGSLQDAQTALQKFNITIGEAADGSATVQQAFNKVNVSLNDLRNLSQQDLLQKTIQGLAKIKDASERARVANELLGKSFRGIDILGLANDYARAVEESRKYAGAIKTADEVQNNLETSITNLQVALLQVLKPVGDLAKSITTNIDQTVRWISAIVEVGKVLATFFIIGRIVKLIGILGGGILAVIKNLGAAKDAFKKLFTEAGDTKAIATITVKYKELIKLLEEGNFAAFRFAVRLKKLVEGFADVAIGIGGAILGYLGLTKAIDKFNQVLQQQELEDIVDYIDQLNESSTEAWMTAQENAKAEREVIDALQQKITAIKEVGITYAKQNEQLIKSVQLEKDYLSLSEDEVETRSKLLELENQFRSVYDQLVAQRNKLTSAQKEERDAINETIVSTFRQFTADEKRLKAAIEGLQQARQAQEEFARSIENSARELEKLGALADLQEELNLIGLYGDELEKQTRLNEINKNLREQQRELAIELLKLDKDRTKIGELNYNAERQRIIKQMADAVELSEARIAAFEEEQKRKVELEQSYAEGAKRALQDIAEQFKPINVAQDAVKRGWDKISDAIDSYAETGKFKFSDFARSVIIDLGKMIAKAMIFKAISAALGGFGLKIPGLASGGPAKAGQPYIVGEKGPELFVPQNSGKVIPNNQLDKGMNAGVISAPVTNNYNTYNINALDAKSVAQLFAENRKAIFGANKMAEREMSYAGAR